MSEPYPPGEDDYYRDPYSQPPSPTRRAEVRYSSQKPLITYILLATTVAVYLLQELTGAFLGVDLPVYYGIKVNDLIVSGQYWRLITPVLLHGSILHIGFNMYALFIFGPGLERHFGRWRFLALYLLSGFAGNVISFVFTQNPSLGSSTAIFGLLGAQGIFLYQNQELFAGRARGAIQQLAMIALINLLIGLSPGIDNWGHIGGLVGGILFTWLGGPRLRLEGFAPYLSVIDERDNSSTITAGLLVGSLFTIIAAAVIYLRAM